MTTVPNRPSPEGERIGANLARLTENGLAILRRRFPKHAEPCQSCAFRRGTVPNRCLPTVSDALKCVIEKRDFMCHQSKDCRGICTGYLIAMSVTENHPPINAPWQFSHEEERA